MMKEWLQIYTWLIDLPIQQFAKSGIIMNPLTSLPAAIIAGSCGFCSENALNFRLSP
jgi:hypothetical protein